MTREEAIERIRQRINGMSWCIDDEDKDAITTLIPELAESEDERIRKAIIKMLKVPRKEIYEQEGITKEQALIYLEKQKEQKLFSAEETELNSIAFLKQLGYTCFPPEVEQKPAEWSKEDEKRRLDILRLIEEANNKYIKEQGQSPFSGNILWLKKLPSRLNLQPKQEWSEKDEEMRDKITNYLCTFIYPDSLYREAAKECINWLKSLRSQPHWKPSKREMDAFETALKGEFQNGVYPASTLCELFGKLKKLYYNDEIPPHWRPSEEQMEALKEASASWMNEEMGNCELLESLYNDLKKLM